MNFPGEEELRKSISRYFGPSTVAGIKCVYVIIVLTFLQSLSAKLPRGIYRDICCGWWHLE